jgi:hypothetical protein
MSFLHPLYLLAALAALVPLIIHLLHRQRARIEAFPSLEFLRRMMRRRSRRFHLKQILLLIARILLVLFIALALARPTITGGRVVKGHLPTTAVIILDDSFSMARRTSNGRLFELAERRILDLLDYLDRSDEVFLLTGSAFSGGITDVRKSEPDRLRERIAGLAVSNLKTDIAGPFARAVTILEESENPNKEIYLVSDMQKLGWDSLEDSLGGEVSDVKVMIVDVGEEDANACVRDILFRIPAGSDDLEADITFERFNSDDSQGRVAEVYLRDGLFDRAVFSPGDFSRETETFRIPAFGGFVWGRVAMAEDKLELDDTRYFAVPSRRRAIGIVGDDFYLRTALSPGRGGSFHPMEIEEGAVSREMLAAVDVLIVADVARFSPLEVEAITDYVAGGGSVLILLGNNVDIGAYNRNLLPRLSTLTIEGPSLGGGSGFYTIERLERNHPVFSKFKADESPFSDARFFRFMKVNPGGGRVIASFSDGSPAVIEASDRIMVLTSSTDASWNDFALTSQFLPIIHETLLYLSSQLRISQSYELGDEIVVRVADTEGEVILEGPTGAVRHFPEAMGQTHRYRFDSPSEPGIYFLRTDQETLSVFAVNVDVSESDLTKVSFDEVESKLKHFDVRRVSATDDIGEAVSLLRRGRDLARTLLWAALGLVVFETLLASSIWLGFRRDQDEDAFTHS